MRSTIIIILGVVLLIPLFSLAQSTVGCCCDPVVKNGSFSTPVDCADLGFTFVGPPPSIAVTCSEHCNATLAPPTIGLCGDGICQASETAGNCPGDCAAIIAGCGSPTYRPKPENLNVQPVKAKKALQLSFILPCTADYINISRCEGTNCQNFQKIAEIPPTTIFTDEDVQLEFNKDYTYAVSAHYSISGDSQPATTVGNIGDIECWYQQTAEFCVSDYYYDQFSEHLTRFGYADYTGEEFNANFGRVIDLTFATRFNKAWQCNDQNLLVSTSPAVTCDERQNEYCISDESGPRCVRREPCDVGFDPFGLLANQPACENLKYCFFGKSKTAANRCYSCDPRMSCYDYKSQGACQRDNCGAGDCQWNTIFEDLGVGVCVDKRYNNCRLCDKKGTVGMENLDASSIIWDACREEKSNALSTQDYPCFYDKDRKQSKTCDEASCADYSPIQCKSPPEGIKLNSDNSLAEMSTDVCEIHVCEYHVTTGCVKNADGNTGAGFQDCRFADHQCEQDYFPPITTLIPTGTAGRIDFINIRIFDKINKSSPPINHAGEIGYKVYLCVKNGTASCNNAKDFSIVTGATQLILKNTKLKEGDRVIAQLKTGNNSIYYYGRDAANNLELIKHTDVYACDDCNGPTLLNLTVTGGRIVGDIIYTSAIQPKFTFTFDEPTQVTFADITRRRQSVPLTAITQGMAQTHEFTPVSQLSGMYNFTLNGHNEKNVYFDPPGLQYTLIVDPELAGVSITPKDGSIINKTTTKIELNFSKPAILRNISLITDTYGNPYSKKEIIRDITSEFSTTDNKSFTANIDQLRGGENFIVVDAQGFNALSIYTQSTFFVATKPPSMRLREPSWGVTAYSVFNASVETPISADCRYVFDTPTAPSSTDFQFFKEFDSLDTIHRTAGLSIPYGDPRNYPLHVYCKFDDFGIIQRSLNITLDPEPPEIVKAFAEPSIIAEQYIPDKEIYVTTLKTQLNKPGFCKYSLITSSFSAMQGTFPGFNEIPKQSLNVEVNATEKKSYSYYITCKGKNELTTVPKRAQFTIDLSLGLNVSSNTPQGFGELDFTIGVVANKRVFCYFGERPDDTTRCMGACTSGYTQWQDVRASNPGQFTYYVKCAHVSGEQSEIVEIPVIVDTSPPQMEYVVDDSVFEDAPDTTWSQNKIRVAFKGNDPESQISHYLITLQGQTDRQIIVKNLVSDVKHGEPFYISTTANGSSFRLSNNKRYSFTVKAVNRVGLESDPLESDGVTVDITRQPEPCNDGEQNQNESDVDCGGPCDGCPENKNCGSNYDCATNYCAVGTCQVASCQDGAKNGLESDVDCGGQVCDRCENDYACLLHTDCLSEYCDIIQGVCSDAPPCADKTLSPGETDIDCGGSCERCQDGQTCQYTTDCTDGLNCQPDTKICSSEPVGDEDIDGVTDDLDQCLDTPLEDEVNEQGCGPSQTYTLGDEIDDKWRLDHFACIDCSQAMLDADPDEDEVNNQVEFRQGTNPTKADTDGDRWKDGVELEKGTDPTNPESHPPSKLLGFLWVLFALLVIGGAGYGAYLLIQSTKKKPVVVVKPVLKTPIITKKDELQQLKTFAKEEKIPDKEWISLEKKIKKKPLTLRKFEDALEGLKRIARKRPKPEEPLQRLRAMLEELGESDRVDLLEKIQLLREGLLTQEEIQKLFRKLKITAEYYKTHKKELEKEARTYGKRK